MASKFLLKSFSLASLVSVTGCASSPPATQRDFEIIINTWVGVPKSRLIEKFGYPDQKHESESGNEVLEYAEAKDHQLPSTTITQPFGDLYISTTTGGGSIHTSCKTFFEIHDSTITKVSWRGDGCIAQPLMTGCRYRNQIYARSDRICTDGFGQPIYLGHDSSENDAQRVRKENDAQRFRKRIWGPD